MAPARMFFIVSTKPVILSRHHIQVGAKEDPGSPSCHKTQLDRSEYEPGISEQQRILWIKQLYFSFNKKQVSQELQNCHVDPFSRFGQKKFEQSA